MISLRIFLLLQIQVLSHNVFNIHSTTHDEDKFCLIYYVRDNIIEYYDYEILAHQIIPYCFRSLEKNIFEINFNNTIDPHFTFVELYEKNITSQQLLSWSASIDLAEQYEIFLQNLTYSLSLNEMIFYNCTLPWFGPSCRFAFDFEVDQSFDEIVVSNFKSRRRLDYYVPLPCYTYLNCKTWLPCLDWRHICNRKRDCFDGSDEINCWQLEINECEENEYRCYNGQCIPKEFFFEISFNPDCLDRTDERDGTNSVACIADPAFRCEEQMCRPGKDHIPCGDGECESEQMACKNGYTYPLLNDLCSIAVACYMNQHYLLHDGACTGCFGNITCIKNRCSSEFEFPPGPYLFGHVRIIYTNKDFRPYRLATPDYVCYNEELCADFLPSTIRINGSTCRHFNELKLYPDIFVTSLADIEEIIVDQFQTCLAVINDIKFCNYSTMYQCQNSTKCISKHRLLDGIQDCLLNDDETFNQSCSLNDIDYRFKCLANGVEKCFGPLHIHNTNDDCDNGADELEEEEILQQNKIIFQNICNRIDDLLPSIIDEQNVTDETECEYWPCNNTYTRCDYQLFCENGADEIICPNSVCSDMHFECIKFNDITKISCLPLNRIRDNAIDCFGGSDEPTFCPGWIPSVTHPHFLCLKNDTYMCIPPNLFCDGIPNCAINNDDERFC